MAPKACRQKAAWGRHALPLREAAGVVGWCLFGSLGVR